MVDTKTLTEKRTPPWAGIQRRKEPRPERIDIGDGLIMRWSTRDDLENVVATLKDAFRWQLDGREVAEDEEPAPNEYVGSVIRRMLRGDHPCMTEYDFALVEDTTLLSSTNNKPVNPIVAAIALHHYPIFYGSVQMRVGMPEAVGSIAQYRNRGLIRKLFLEMIHPAADERRDLMLVIPGIPYFYYQFGYVYALLHRETRALQDHLKVVPALVENDEDEDEEKGKEDKGETKKNEVKEPFGLQPATVEDIPYLVKMSSHERVFSKAQIGSYYSEEFWRFVVEVVRPEKAQNYFESHLQACLVIDQRGDRNKGQERVVGISLTWFIGGEWGWEIFSLETEFTGDDDTRPVTYLEAYPSILRQLAKVGRPHFEAYQIKLDNHGQYSPNFLQANTPSKPRGEFPALELSTLAIALSPHHPVVKLLEPKLCKGDPRGSRRLYTRIANYPAFIMAIAPVLEERLKGSAKAGITAKLQFDFYRKVEGCQAKGLEIVLEHGKVVGATDWEPLTPQQRMMRARKTKEDKEKEGVWSTPSLTAQPPHKQSKALEFKTYFSPLTLTRLMTGSVSMRELQDDSDENYAETDEGGVLLEVLFPMVEHHLSLVWV